MKILIICSGNAPSFNFKLHQAFIYDQVEAIKHIDNTIQFNYFFIKGKGIKGYLSNLKKLKSELLTNNYDIIHAHFALSGLLANLQRKSPVITTFHGSDINVFKTRIVSFFVELLSAKTIYVSKKLIKKSIGSNQKKSSIIPCGVDLNIFKPLNQKMGRIRFGLENDVKYILFSSSFDNKVKNYSLLKEALKHLNEYKIEVIELKGYKRDQVALLMNAVDLCVMTSFSEGSPQFIKEAMACNCPIVSTDVGDVKDIIYGTIGCYISLFSPVDLATKIKKALEFKKKTLGSDQISHLDNSIIANKIVTIYKEVFNAKM